MIIKTPATNHLTNIFAMALSTKARFMQTDNPLRPFHDQSEATFLNYGPGGEGGAIEVVEMYQEYEAEYAAIRKGVGIFDMPQRGLIELRNSDRLDFLHRMVTQNLNRLKPGEGQRTFLLDRTGRINADLIILHNQDCTLGGLDVFQAHSVAEHLDTLLFSEDVRIDPASTNYHHLALHGPESTTLLNKVAEDNLPCLETLDHCSLSIQGKSIIVYRQDDTGSLGLHLIVPVGHVVSVYQELMSAISWNPQQQEDEYARAKRRSRPIGWLAYNTARIEAGVPLYHVDFGPDSLPHETGPVMIKRAVSFTKGCYVGQEIVARMQNLGHPKKLLVKLEMADDRQPIGGAQIFAADQGHSSEVIGAVTSSTISPLRGNVAVAIAMIKWGKHEPGTIVSVPAEGQMVTAVVETLGKDPL